MIKPVKSTAARLPDFVEPMKAKLVDSIRPGDWIYEIKFDGYRAIALRALVKRECYRETKRIWVANPRSTILDWRPEYRAPQLNLFTSGNLLPRSFWFRDKSVFKKSYAWTCYRRCDDH
jgi:hypothetical protein